MDFETRLKFEKNLKAEAAALRSQELLRLARLVGGFLNHRILTPIGRWYRRQQLREDLMRLDDRTLDDIGISRVDIPRFVDTAYAPNAANDASDSESDPRSRLAA
jgi:uncharacterized protein YjiS (DUF1127 family)